MSYKNFNSDPRFTSRIGLLATGFTGFNFGRGDAEWTARNHPRKNKNSGSIPLLKRVLDHCKTLTVRFRDGIDHFMRRRRALAALEGLDQRLLRDIGLTQNDILDLRYARANVSQINARRKPELKIPAGTWSAGQTVPFPEKKRAPRDGEDFRQAA